VAANLVAPDNTLGIRIVKDHSLLNYWKDEKPLVSTSANISGQPTPKSFKEISPEIIKGVDYVVNLQRDKIAGKPSTIIKLTNDSQVKVIRK
jgi:L-threonylcarbamoyladenylate synthase